MVNNSLFSLVAATVDANRSPVDTRPHSDCLCPPNNSTVAGVALDEAGWQGMQLFHHANPRDLYTYWKIPPGGNISGCHLEEKNMKRGREKGVKCKRKKKGKKMRKGEAKG
jgi:hypothetical protein